MSILRLGIADHIDDLHRVREIGDTAGLCIIPEDGSGAAAYAFSIDERDWDRARDVLATSHLFRTGDLRVFLYARKILPEEKRSAEEEAEYSAWRLSLRRQDTLAKENPGI
jgi:hypothetical protein